MIFTIIMEPRIRQDIKSISVDVAAESLQAAVNKIAPLFSDYVIHTVKRAYPDLTDFPF